MKNSIRELRTAHRLSQAELARILPLAIAIAHHFERYVEEIFHVDE